MDAYPPSAALSAQVLPHLALPPPPQHLPGSITAFILIALTFDCIHAQHAGTAGTLSAQCLAPCTSRIPASTAPKVWRYSCGARQPFLFGTSLKFRVARGAHLVGTF